TESGAACDIETRRSVIRTIEKVGRGRPELHSARLLDPHRFEQRERDRLCAGTDDGADGGVARPADVVRGDRVCGRVYPGADGLRLRQPGHAADDVRAAGALQVREVRTHRIRAGCRYREKRPGLEEEHT